ncbi:glycosyltransferase [Oleomonas cavernae]|uniref:Cyclic di-GMP-binding protein n=1 Tax=Oleomonas cavernae TaxID=2320859 RepID=A0A418WD39_9PROT|nr:cellulose biosynthesis cyclic di-GMP-binding regulatory protein BcsB [Oleomonas cavernae]RJF87933.1 glycosyltransferase [Oleomonas cavernae]
MKVFLLDDGRREEFREFAAEAGVGYIIRPDNLHAKAGNLNNAMQETSGELIAIFDCDHVATRAFLQLTAGWFLEDPRLALIQTPHHFYSPDPFERNLKAGHHMPNEGELFYGPVQEGNDLWNAAFFCGSCALLRRGALDEIGGFATETVTEDAHTALKLQRRGWNTAYLNIRLAAGLATERLAIHIGQRMRWARGMTQILRRDNPLFGPGLTWAQRLCYLSAMLHFQFGLPRIVFLTAPLVYLLLGESLITASAASLVAYAIPHLFHSVMTTRRIQGRQRLTFWGEIYETVLAFHLAGITIRTFLDPRAGKFNVTNKGGLLPDDYFDARILRPHMVVATLLVLGSAFGFVKLAFPATFGVDWLSVALNVVWAVFSLVILLCAIAVGREARQIRRAFRVDSRQPATIFLEDGHTLACETENLSMGGVAVVLPQGVSLGEATITDVELPCGEASEIFPVVVARRGNGGNIGLHFSDMPLYQRRELVKSVLGRSDAWTPSQATMVPPPVFHSLVLIARVLLSLFTRRKNYPSSPTVAVIAALFLALGGLLPGVVHDARAQTAPATIEPPPAAAAAPTPPALLDQAPAAQGATRKLVLSLKDLGASGPLRLIGVHGEAWLPVSLRRDEVVTAAKMTLALGYSPALIPELSHLSIFINGELTGSIQLIKERSGGVTVELPINPALFLPESKLNLQFIAHYTRECEDPLHSTLWGVVSNVNSMLELTVQRLPQQDDLASLPAPFFDLGDTRPLSLPFVMAGKPSAETLRAAAAVAGYFGSRAGQRGFGFPVVHDHMPEGHAVVLATPGDAIPGLTLPEIKGPTLAVTPNPADPDHKLLMVLGRNGDELQAAAYTLGIGSQALSGPSAAVGMPQLLPRVPYDATRWIPSDRPVKLGEFVEPPLLQGLGLYSGVLAANFRSAPDLFTWGKDGIPLQLRYRYPDGEWLDRDLSRLDVAVNGKFLKSFPTTQPSDLDRIRDAVGTDFIENEATVNIPPYEVFGQNQLQFLFDLKSNKRGECQGYLPNDVRTSIDPDSTVDFSDIHHFARFPNLGFFAGAGYPFTRLADLSETVVILREQATAPEIETFLVLMGRAADATGNIATKLTILRNTKDVSRMLGRDVLIIGSTAFAGSLGGLMTNAPFQIEGDMLRVKATGALDRLFTYFDGGEDSTGGGQADRVLVEPNNFTGMLSFRSPYAADRVVVAVLAASPAALPAVAYGLRDTEQNARIGGDLAILGSDGYTSYSAGETFWRGDLPFFTHVRWFLSDRPLLMIAVILVAMLLLTVPVYAALRSLARRRLRHPRG